MIISLTHGEDPVQYAREIRYKQIKHATYFLRFYSYVMCNTDIQYHMNIYEQRDKAIHVLLDTNIYVSKGEVHVDELPYDESYKNRRNLITQLTK